MKNEMSISVEGVKLIKVRAHSSLEIVGTDSADVSFKTDLNVQRTKRDGAELVLIFVAGCEMQAPHGVPIVVDRASGNVRVRDLQSAVNLNKVFGNLAVQNVQKVTMGKVSGNVLAENLTEKVTIGKVYGNLKGRAFHKKLEVGRVSGGVDLLKLRGGACIRSYGDIKTGFDQLGSDNIDLRTSGSIYLNLPQMPDAEIDIKSAGLNTELEIGDRVEKINVKRRKVLLGDGSSKINLDAGGRIRIKAEELTEEEITRLFAELDNLWGKLKEENELKRQLKSKEKYPEIEILENVSRFVEDAMEGVIDTASITAEIAEEAVKEAESRVVIAIGRIEKEMEDLGIEIQIGDINLPPIPPIPPLDPMKPIDPLKPLEPISPVEDKKMYDYDVSEEERLLIIRMLEQKKISVEEADRLLEALERSVV